MASQFLASNATNELLAFNDRELMKLCENLACTNAKKLISAIENVAASCGSINLPLPPDTMSILYDHYITQFGQCFKDEYNAKTSRPRVLRSVSENEEVFESGSGFSRPFGYTTDDLGNFGDTSHHKLQGNGVTFKDNESKFSSAFPFIPKTARRRMSADDVALATSLGSPLLDARHQKNKKNKHIMKRGISFHGGAKSEGKDVGQSGDGSSRGIVSSVFNRLRRASYSRQGKVSLLVFGLVCHRRLSYIKLFFPLSGFASQNAF